MTKSLHHRCSFPREPVASCGIELLTTWQVHAGVGYAVQADRSRADSYVRINKAGRHLVALWTASGAGAVLCAGRQHELTGGSLLLFDFPSLECYRSSGPLWDFWWFEFRPTEPVRLPLHRVLATAVEESDGARCDEVFRLLRSEDVARRCRAAAVLQERLLVWWGRSGAVEAGHDRARLRVEQLIEAMHRDPAHPWTLETMIAHAGMSTSSLRTAFLRLTGKPPSKIRNSLRLAHAYGQLRRGDKTVSEVAADLGFCDPFHFSKSFRAEYGFPPSSIRRRTHASEA